MDIVTYTFSMEDDKVKYNLNNKKLGAPRLWWIPYNKKTKMSPSVLVKCGDCNEKVRIYYDHGKDRRFGLEINGVLGSYEFWEQLFKKLGMNIKEKNSG